MFRILILKLTSFCNLNCTYCYMFNSRDQSFRMKPQHMSVDAALAALDAFERQLAGERNASLVLHGGEPTLWPVESFRALLARVAEMRCRGVSLTISLQTNLWQRPRPEFLALCREHNVHIGMSLDGPKGANDANRVDFAGHGSYDKVLANTRWLLEQDLGNRVLGFLCVMQPEIDPAAFVAWLDQLPQTRIDLLWPIEFNVAMPPWQEGDEETYSAAPRYGAWAAKVFELWWQKDRPELEVRLFKETIEAQLGGGAATDVMGGLSFRTVAVNTDGQIELADYFRTAADGASETGYSIFEHGFEVLAGDARVQRLRARAEKLPDACTGCRNRQVCRGGTLSGRLDAAGEVTAERSVMCHDHMRFFDTVARLVGEEMAVAAD